MVLPSVLTFTAMAGLAVRFAVKAQLAPVATGVEGLSGELGTVTKDLGPEGMVFVHGELWDATSTTGDVAVGTRVRVVRADDMMLTVEVAEPESPGSPRSEKG